VQPDLQPTVQPQAAAAKGRSPLRLVLPGVCLLGFLASAGAFVALVIDPAALEREARAQVTARIQRELASRFPLIEDGGRLAALRDKLAGTANRLGALLQTEAPEAVGEVLARLCRYDCETGEQIGERIRGRLEGQRLRGLLGVDRVVDWAHGRYQGLVMELVGELRLFTGANALVFALAFIASVMAPVAYRRIRLAIWLLVASTVAAAWLYVFHQGWFTAILFADYVGTAYLVWIGAVFALLLDAVFNRGRVVEAVVSSLGSAPGS
jgi:hypothetical protein